MKKYNNHSWKDVNYIKIRVRRVKRLDPLNAETKENICDKEKKDKFRKMIEKAVFSSIFRTDLVKGI